MATVTHMHVHHLELDLSSTTAFHPHSIADRINHVVPGLKTSTAFFTFLRANLALEPSTMASNVSTPLLEPIGITQGLAPPSPSPSPLAKHITDADDATTSSSPHPHPNLDDIPPLTLDVLTTHDDKVDALNLIADSIAQQRQRASYALIFHPLLACGLAAALAITYQLAWARRPAPDRDPGVAMILFSGVVMAYLLAVRYATAGYIQLAEGLGWDWLVAPDTGDEDVVVAVRFGREVIGALVLRLETSAAAATTTPRKRRGGGGGGGGGHHGVRKGGRGVVRAWTTKLRYRGKGVGGDLLHEAVRVTRERCGRDAEVGFAAGHANSGMVLPEMFNRGFRRGERRAALALDGVLGEWEGVRRKR